MLLFLAALLALAAPAEAETRVKVLKVHDGDSLLVLHQGKKTKLRVLGLDAPESRPGRHAGSQARRLGLSQSSIVGWGKKAGQRARQLLPVGSRVRLEADRRQPRRDRYGRLLAHLYLPDGRLFSKVMIREGLAEVYRRFNFRHKNELLRAEAQARRERAGIWSQARKRGN